MRCATTCPLTLNPLISLILLGLCGCSAPSLGTRAGDYGHCVPLGGGRVATAEHVTARSGRLEVRVGGRWLSGQTVERHELEALPWADALVVVELDGELGEPPTFRRLGPGDSGRPLFDSRGRCVGVYLGRRWSEAAGEEEAVGVFAPPRLEWCGGRAPDR